MKKFEKFILLDDNAHTRLDDFLMNKGLQYLEKELQIENGYAIILEGGGESLCIYDRCGKTEKSFPAPTNRGISKRVMINILNELNTENQNILILCDLEWKLNLRGDKIKNSLDKMVKVFKEAKISDDNVARYNHLEMIFYTTLLDNKGVKMPKSDQDIFIKQKSILEWCWNDITSSAYRVKEILESDENEGE